MSRTSCKAFEKDGYCRFGDSCKNLHIGFTVCDLCGVEIEELTEEVSLVQEEKKKDKAKEKSKGPANVFAFLDSDSESGSNSDSEEEEEEEDDKVIKAAKKVAEVSAEFASSSISAGDDDDFQQVDVKTNRQAAAVKERIVQSAMCCKGGRVDVRTSHQSKESVSEFIKNKGEWKVGVSVDDEWALPEGTEELLKETVNSQEVERAMLGFLHNMQKEDIEKNTVSGYSTRPWSMCASDMKDHKSMLECFSLQSNVSHGSAGAGPAAVGNIFHSILESAAAAPEEGGEARLGPDWQGADDGVIEVKEIGLKMHGCSDAFFRDMPVELKTVSSLKMLKDLQKVRGWLNQIAVYQSESTTAAILLVIARDTFEVKAYEVGVGNIAAAVAQWEEIFERDKFLRSLMTRAQSYVDSVEAWKQTRFSQNTPNKCFLQLLAEVPQLFGNEILALSNKCREALASKDTYRESCQFYKDAKRLNMRSGTKKQLKKRLFDDEETIQALYESLDQAIQEKAEELYQQMVALCPLLYADFSTYEVEVMTEAIELGRLSAEMYEALLGMQNSLVPPMRAHILKLKTAIKAKKGGEDDEDDEADEDEDKKVDVN